MNSNIWKIYVSNPEFIQLLRNSELLKVTGKLGSLQYILRSNTLRLHNTLFSYEGKLQNIDPVIDDHSLQALCHQISLPCKKSPPLRKGEKIVLFWLTLWALSEVSPGMRRMLLVHITATRPPSSIPLKLNWSPSMECALEEASLLPLSPYGHTVSARHH